MNDQDETSNSILNPTFLVWTVLITICLVARAFRPIPFELAIPDWTIHAADGSIARITPAEDSQTVRFEIRRNAAKEPWDIALRRHVSLTRGRRYVLRFEARSDQPRDAVCLVREFHPPWDTAGLYVPLRLAAEWRKFEFPFEASLGSDHAVVEWLAGMASHAMEIRDFEFKGLPPSLPSGGAKHR